MGGIDLHVADDLAVDLCAELRPRPGEREIARLGHRQRVDGRKLIDIAMLLFGGEEQQLERGQSRRM